MKKILTFIITCLLLTSCLKDYSKEVVIEVKQTFPKSKIYKETFGEGLIIVDSSGIFRAENSTSIAQNKLNVIFTKLKEVK